MIPNDIVSIIVPCYNEEANIRPFYAEVKSVFAAMQQADADKNALMGGGNPDFEILFINDGSKDRTLEKIKELHKEDSRAKGISFARNFGKEAALFAGIHNAQGNCVAFLDADLQHPPALLADMYKKWKEGFDVIEGVKTDRGKESLFSKIFSKIFYYFISKAVGMDMRNSSDYKMLDRKVIDELKKIRERNTFFRALSFWVGFKKTVVFYEVQERSSGISKWSTRSLFKYAINNVISFSYAPLNVVTGAGAAFLLIGIGFAIDALISYIRGTANSGFPTLIFVLLIGFGGTMLSLGIIGVYIAQIYDEVKGRPQYIIEEKIE